MASGSGSQARQLAAARARRPTTRDAARAGLRLAAAVVPVSLGAVTVSRLLGGGTVGAPPARFVVSLAAGAVGGTATAVALFVGGAAVLRAIRTARLRLRSPG